jgi:Protein of unknown function (DUF3047)
LRKFLFLGSIMVLGFQAVASQLGFIVLDLGGLTSGQLPAGWQIKVNHGRPNITFGTDRDGSFLHLKSVKSSFSLEREVDVDPEQMPLLTWRWKVAELPKGGDFRHSATDDQAAQVLVAFMDRRVISYIWDTIAPRGTMEIATSIPLVHIYALVCESGDAEMNRWLPESHNILADYLRAYGKQPPHVKGLRLQINSQHTGSDAESYFGEVAFHSAQQ